MSPRALRRAVYRAKGVRFPSRKRKPGPDARPPLTDKNHVTKWRHMPLGGKDQNHTVLRHIARPDCPHCWGLGYQRIFLGGRAPVTIHACACVVRILSEQDA